MKNIVLLFIALSLSGCAALTEHSVGLVSGKLSPCPQWPRCVNSDSVDPDKEIAPLKITGDVDTAWTAARHAVADLPRSKIVQQRDDYMHAEIISPWHFYTDDLELNLRRSQQEIAVRSSGRIGYYDFHVNRDRVQALRQTLAELGAVSAGGE